MRMHELDARSPEGTREAQDSCRVERAVHRNHARLHALRPDEVEERPVRRRDERDLVAGVAGGPRELKRDHLPAGDVAADDDMRDPHVRGRAQTA
jgi:hypothetical protein